LVRTKTIDADRSRAFKEGRVAERGGPLGAIASLVVRGPLEREDLPGLLARAHALCERTAPDVLRCELHDVAADAIVVDALARLALAARRAGCELRLGNPGEELRALVTLVGLAQVLRE
jgi:ABC-type transporter Mla MlaB component